MYPETKKLQIDRIEEEIAVAFSKDGKKYIIKSFDNAFCEGDIINATIDESGNVASFEVLSEETSLKKSTLLERLKKLFKK
ncbi:MAG: DUF3006 family protein [Clostridia bacterium]|nr:DUF3006 family protein [Clostridia bacterium]